MRIVAARQPKLKTVLSRSFFGYQHPVPELFPVDEYPRDVLDSSMRSDDSKNAVFHINKRHVGEGPLLIFTFAQTNVEDKRPHTKLDWGSLLGVKPRSVRLVTGQWFRQMMHLSFSKGSGYDPFAQIRGQIIGLDSCPDTVILDKDTYEKQCVFICKAEKIILRSEDPRIRVENIDKVLAGVFLGLNGVSSMNLVGLRCEDKLLDDEQDILRESENWGKRLLTHNPFPTLPEEVSSILRAPRGKQ